MKIFSFVSLTVAHKIVFMAEKAWNKLTRTRVINIKLRYKTSRINNYFLFSVTWFVETIRSVFFMTRIDASIAIFVYFKDLHDITLKYIVTPVILFTIN